MNFSDEEDDVKEQKLKKKMMKRGKKTMARVFKQEIDTNVYKISLSTLKDVAELATGDPIFCLNCQAVFNKHSKVEEIKAE